MEHGNITWFFSCLIGFSAFLYRIQPKIFSVLTQISKNFVGLSHASRIWSVMEFENLGFFIACHQVPMVWVLIDADSLLLIFIQSEKNKSVWLFKTIGCPNHEIFSTKNRKNDRKWSILRYDFVKIPVFNLKKWSRIKLNSLYGALKSHLRSCLRKIEKMTHFWLWKELIPELKFWPHYEVNRRPYRPYENFVLQPSMDHGPSNSRVSSTMNYLNRNLLMDTVLTVSSHIWNNFLTKPAYVR